MAIDRRVIARRAFWTDQPLNLRFRATIGDRAFSLREFIGFVEALPAEDLTACMSQHDCEVL